MENLRKLILEFLDVDLSRNFRLLYEMFTSEFQQIAAETKTNRLDASGASIYTKYVALASLPNTTTTTVAHGITGLSTIQMCRVFAGNGSGNFVTFEFGGATRVSISGADISITTDFNGTGYSGYCRIDYTKT